MHILRTLSVPILLLLASTTFAQEEKEVIIARSKGGEEYRFTVEQKDPKNMDRLYVGGILLGMEVGDGFWMGFGVDAHYRLNEQLILNGSWFRPYGKGTDSEMGEYYDDRGDGLDLRLYNHTELGGTWSFAERVKPRKVKMVLKETGGGGSAMGATRMVYMLRTEVPDHRRFGGRFGYSYYQQSAGGSLKLAVDTITASRPVQLTSFTMHSVYLGLSTTSFQHYQVSGDDFGSPVRSRWRSFYADLIIGLGGTSAFHAYDPLAEGNADYAWNAPDAIKRLGWRVGWERVNRSVSGKHFGMMMGVEAGSRPVPDLTSYNGEADAKIAKGYFVFRVALLYTK